MTLDEAIKECKVAYRCIARNSVEEYNELMRKLEADGYTWSNGRRPTDYNAAEYGLPVGIFIDSFRDLTRINAPGRVAISKFVDFSDISNTPSNNELCSFEEAFFGVKGE